MDQSELFSGLWPDAAAAASPAPAAPAPKPRAGRIRRAAADRFGQLREWRERLAADENLSAPEADFARSLTADETERHRARLAELREQRRMLNGTVYTIDGAAYEYWKRARVIPARIARVKRPKTRDAALRRIDEAAEALLERFEDLDQADQAKFRTPDDLEALELYGNMISHELPVPLRHRDYMPVPQNVRRAAQLATLQAVLDPPPAEDAAMSEQAAAELQARWTGLRALVARLND